MARTVQVTDDAWTDIRAGASGGTGGGHVRRPHRVLTLELDRTVPGAGFDVVAVGVHDLAGIAAEIDERRVA